MARNVVVGYDGSDEAKAAVDRALDLSRLENGELTIVCAVPGPRKTLMGATLHLPAVSALDEYWRDALEKVEAEVEEVARQARATGIVVETVCVRDDPVALIMRAARDTGCKWIVVGAHGAGRGQDITALGSNVLKLLHQTRFAVVVVPG